MTPVKVLIHGSFINQGGMHTVFDRLIEGLLQVNDPSEFQFEVLAQANDGRGYPIDWQGLPFEQIRPGTNPTTEGALVEYLIENAEVFYAHLQEYVKKHAIDIIWFPAAVWNVGARRFRPPAPLVVCMHDFSWDESLTPLHPYRYDIQTLARTASAFTFASQYQRDYGTYLYGFENTYVIPWGNNVHLDFMPTYGEARRVRERYHLPEHYILAFHCATSKKDPLTILRGQLLARQQSELVPPLVIAGLHMDYYDPRKPVPYRDWYTDQVRETILTCGYTLDQDLFMLGHIPNEDVGGLYAGATMAVSSSVCEAGINSTMFEAFTAHIPMVYSDLPMFSEELGTNDEYGRRFKLGDPENLAAAIIETASDRTQALQRAQRAFAYVNNRTWKKTARSFLDVFRAVSQRRQYHAAAD